MKFDLNTEIFNEQTLKLVALARLPKPPPSPLSQVFSSLLITGINEERIAADVKAKRFALLCKIGIAAESAGHHVDLTVDDLAIIMPLIDAGCPALVFGRVKEILNAPEAK